MKKIAFIIVLGLLAVAGCAEEQAPVREKEAAPTASEQDSAADILERAKKKHADGDYEAAIADYTESIKLAPDSAAAYKGRGDAKYDSGDFEGAIPDFDKAIELEPNDAETFNWRGIAKCESGDLDGGIEDYTEAIRLKPGKPVSAIPALYLIL